MSLPRHLHREKSRLARLATLLALELGLKLAENRIASVFQSECPDTDFGIVLTLAGGEQNLPAHNIAELLLRPNPLWLPFSCHGLPPAFPFHRHGSGRLRCRHEHHRDLSAAAHRAAQP